MLSLPSLVGCFPFRLGTTSYVIPADIKTNVEILAGKVDDVELLFFESHKVADLPDKETILFLQSVARRADLSYTVHLPLDCRLGHPDKEERERSLDKCRRITDRVGPLEPFAYVLHLGNDRSEGHPVGDVPAWQDRLLEALQILLLEGVDPSRLCIENLDYPFALAAPVVEALGLSVCLDVGHVIAGGYPLDDYLDSYLHRARVVHLHGVRDGRDHQTVSFLAREVLKQLYFRLSRDRSLQRVVTLEVFDEANLMDSIATMEAFIQ